VTAHHVTRPWESTLFKRCRRAWDLGARERQDYEPAEPVHMFDFGEAIHDALDVYYFPGMWEWDRGIVLPLAVAGFDKSMRRQRANYAQFREPSAEQVQDWEEHLELGRAMLRRYFDWALQTDRFTPVQVAAQFDVTVPDPASPDSGLTTHEGRSVQFRVRIDTVVIDDHELYWLIEHRIVTGPQWPSLDQLILDGEGLTRAWAWQEGFLAKLEGTVHNELRLTAPAAGPAGDQVDIRAVPGPGGIITQRTTGSFRRTHIPRTELEIERHGTAVALEIQDTIDPGLRIYPNPTSENCSGCAYRSPCLAINQGADAAPVLEASYRRRTGEDFQPGRLGSVWGFVPEIHRIDDYRRRG
jgi:hypothetical protein